jgi:hypothetical protein
MEHIALWEGAGDGTPGTTWAEPVTDSQYGGPRARNARDAASPRNTKGKESTLLATLNL